MAVPVSFDRTNITFDSTGYTWDATSEETGIEVNPGFGSLSIEGFAPSLSTTDNKNIFPDTGALLIDGFVPIISSSDNKNILPSFGELAILGFSPEVIALDSQNVFPLTGALIIIGSSPVVFTSNIQIVYPESGELLITGNNPKVTVFNKVVLPQSGTIIIAGYSPSVQLDNKTIFPGTGSLTFRGFRPITTGQIENNCNSDSEQLERIIRGSENTMSDLYALISASISKYFEVLASCCIGKNNNLKSAIILIDDYTNFNDQAGDVINEVIDDIIDKILEDTPEVAIQYGAAYFNGVCIKELTPNLETVIEASFQSHICVLFEEPLPNYTYEAEYGNFVCSYDQGELFPYTYEALFNGHTCILRDGNYFYPEYSASFINFICEFEPACDTFSTVLCTSSELCELSMTSEWLDYSCFIAERDFDISFADHSCIKNMNYDVSYQGHVCVLMPRVFCASFIDFVCVLIEEVTTTTTQEVATTTTLIVSTTTTTPEVTTTTTTSGVYPVNYGYLYNGWAFTSASNIANAGWHIPTNAEYQALSTYLGGNSVSGGKLKETGTTYWNSPNTGATNEVSFNARGAGYRGFGSFIDLKASCKFPTNDISGGNSLNTAELSSGSAAFDLNGSRFTSFIYGFPVRLVKDQTTLSHGQTGRYLGNDGKVYRTICINGAEWLADNLTETKYRNGDAIPEVADNTTWAGLTTGALCAFNNDWSNV